MSLLTIIQTACDELGIVRPALVAGNVDNQIRQLMALANREGQELAERPEGWQMLRKVFTFNTNGVKGFTGNVTSGAAKITGLSSTTGIQVGMTAVSTGVPIGATVLSVDSASQVTLNTPSIGSYTGASMTFGFEAYALPADLLYIIPQTAWDRSYRWQLMGPMEAQEWQVLKSGITPTGPRRRFRIMGGKIWLDPVPSDSTSLMAFEYYSNAWCQSAANASQTSFQADTDTALVPEELITLGVKWRFLRAKGLSYDEERDAYDRAVERAMSRDKTTRILPLNAQNTGNRLLNAANVPDTGFGS